MKNLMILLALFFLFACKDNSPIPDTPELVLSTLDEDQTVHNQPEDSWTCILVIEEQAQFPGGKKAWVTFLTQQLNARKTDAQLAVTGRVFVSFTVNKDGSIENPKILRGSHHSWDKIILEAIKASPDWIPAKQRGLKLKSRMSIVINMCL